MFRNVLLVILQQANRNKKFNACICVMLVLLYIAKKDINSTYISYYLYILVLYVWNYSVTFKNLWSIISVHVVVITFK